MSENTITVINDTTKNEYTEKALKNEAAPLKIISYLHTKVYIETKDII